MMINIAHLWAEIVSIQSSLIFPERLRVCIQKLNFAPIDTIIKYFSYVS